MGTQGSFVLSLEVKWLVSGVDHSPPSAEVKECVVPTSTPNYIFMACLAEAQGQLYLYSPQGLLHIWLVFLVFALNHDIMV
jgi:hypothetical protein